MTNGKVDTERLKKIISSAREYGHCEAMILQTRSLDKLSHIEDELKQILKHLHQNVKLLGYDHRDILSVCETQYYMDFVKTIIKPPGLCS